MSESIVTDEEGNRYSLDNALTQKWLEGQPRGVDVCVEWLLSEANALFADRKTQEAINLQKLADRMKQSVRPRLVKQAEEHESEHPWRLEKEVRPRGTK